MIATTCNFQDSTVSFVICPASNASPQNFIPAVQQLDAGPAEETVGAASRLNQKCPELGLQCVLGSEETSKTMQT